LHKAMNFLHKAMNSLHKTLNIIQNQIYCSDLQGLPCELTR
jgi:hypothetical protein